MKHSGGVWQLDFRHFYSMVCHTCLCLIYPDNTPVRQGSPVYPLTHGEQKLRCLRDLSKVTQWLFRSNCLATKPSFLLPTQEICTPPPLPIHCNCVRASFKGRQAERLLSNNHTRQRISVTPLVEIPSVDTNSLYQPVYTGYLSASPSGFRLLFYTK